MSKIAWLEKNGFDRYTEDTYVIVENDTYSIKEQLKADGYKYDKVLGWHTAYPNKEYAHIMVNFNQICEYSAFDNVVKYKLEAPEYIEKQKKKFLPTESRFEYFGEEGEKYEGVKATFHSQKGFQGKYGWTYIYTFYTENDKECLVWFTSSMIYNEPGSAVELSFTVKGYEEYNGEETTLITRCKIK